MERKCKFCGNTLSEGIKFCTHCGAPIEIIPSAENVSDSPTVRIRQHETQKIANTTHGGNRKRKWIWIATVAILAALLTVVIIGVQREKKIAQQRADELERKHQELQRERAFELQELKRQQDSIAADHRLRKDGMKSFISVLNSKRNNLYDSSYAFTTADITGDNYPEMIVQTGSCEADRTAHIYDISSGVALKIGEIGMSHSGLAKGDGYIIAVCGWNNEIIWTKITYDGSKIHQKEIYNYVPEVENDDGTLYPPAKKLKEPDLQWYGISDTDVIRSAIGL